MSKFAEGKYGTCTADEALEIVHQAYLAGEIKDAQCCVLYRALLIPAERQRSDQVWQELIS